MMKLLRNGADHARVSAKDIEGVGFTPGMSEQAGAFRLPVSCQILAMGISIRKATQIDMIANKYPLQRSQSLREDAPTMFPSRG